MYNTILPYGNRLFGHSITVVNRSEVVGRPLAALLANDGACVYSVDVTGVQQFTRGEGIKERRHRVVEKEGWGLKDCVPLSDVIITGVPGESFKFPTELLRDGAVCINFSTEKVRDMSCYLAQRHSEGECGKALIVALFLVQSYAYGSRSSTLTEEQKRILAQKSRRKRQSTFQQLGR